MENLSSLLEDAKVTHEDGDDLAAKEYILEALKTIGYLIHQKLCNRNYVDQMMCRMFPLHLSILQELVSITNNIKHIKINCCA